MAAVIVDPAEEPAVLGKVQELSLNLDARFAHFITGITPLGGEKVLCALW